MEITAKDVMKLRQMTSAGMMDCKKALIEAEGDFNKAVEISATNPAKLFGIDYCKGAIEVGLDADIVIYDPKKNVVINNKKNQHGALDHTVWEGVECKGYPCAVFSHGKLVFDGTDFVGKQGAGSFVKQKKVHHKGPTF